MLCHCGNQVPPARLDYGLRTCLTCGDREAKSSRPFGYPSYAHKTAGAIVITSKAGFTNYKRVSYRHAKGSNMSSASKAGTQF